MIDVNQQSREQLIDIIDHLWPPDVTDDGAKILWSVIKNNWKKLDTDILIALAAANIQREMNLTTYGGN